MVDATNIPTIVLYFTRHCVKILENNQKIPEEFPSLQMFLFKMGADNVCTVLQFLSAAAFFIKIFNFLNMKQLLYFY